VQADEPGHLFGLKMALRSVLHHTLQLSKGIGFGKDVMSECSGDITAAEKSKLALLYWAIDQRLGIDFGDGKLRSGATKAGLALLQKQHGCPVRNDIHGIDVYEHVEKLNFVSVTEKLVVGKSPLRLIDTFQSAYFSNRQFTEKQRLAGEIYASSFFDVTPRSRFVTLITAVEALLERSERSDVVKQLVREFKKTTQLLDIDEQTKKSIIGSLEDLERESITQAARMLVGRLIPDAVFDGQSSFEFFKRCYNLRIRILHDGKVEDYSVDPRHLASVMQDFVSKLLLAALNNRPCQDTSDGILRT
jgi:hypothetical protein